MNNNKLKFYRNIWDCAIRIFLVFIIPIIILQKNSYGYNIRKCPYAYNEIKNYSQNNSIFGLNSYKIMHLIFGDKYNFNSNCIVEYKTLPSWQNKNNSIEGWVYISYLNAAFFDKRRFLAVLLKENMSGYDCNACPAIIGDAILKKEGRNWVTININKNIFMGGQDGTIPVPKVVIIGENNKAFLFKIPYVFTGGFYYTGIATYFWTQS